MVPQVSLQVTTLSESFSTVRKVAEMPVCSRHVLTVWTLAGTGFAKGSSPLRLIWEDSGGGAWEEEGPSQLA